MNKRELTKGEREMIAGACWRHAEELEMEANMILSGGSQIHLGVEEPASESSSKQERLAAAIVASARRLQKQATRYHNLGCFVESPSNTITVDCIILIPEQA